MYPGLFKPIMLTPSRYNQHTGKYANIIEVGATGNTLEQCLTSMKYLSAVMNEVLKSCVKHGIKYAETGPELEDNLNVQRQWKNYDHELIRKRRLYISKIGDLLLDE